MSTYWRDHLLKFIPAEYGLQDISVGDLDAFCQVVAIPMDEFEDLVDQFTSIWDIDNCDSKYLKYIARTLNYPLSERDTIDSQRLQLKQAVDWYKQKGLNESFRILFYSLGYFANIVDLWTRDYKTFHRYPGTFTPQTFHAKVKGTSLIMMTITPANRRLRLSIDGSSEIEINLALGNNRLLTSIADEIDAAIDIIDGDCTVESGYITITSRQSGEDSIINIISVEASAYNILGFKVGSTPGIDFNVPNDWPELQENGGQWYKSPHFGIEVQSIKDYVLDPDEFNYIHERVELVRPAHTVLEWIDYAKKLADVFSVSESDILGDIEVDPIEVFPLPVCMDRGQSHEFEYIRNGLVPNRSEATRIAYSHNRKSRNDCIRRDSFSYTYTNLVRDNPSGPIQMNDRSIARAYRSGYPEGTPKRNSCNDQGEVLTGTINLDDLQNWCAEPLRLAGLKHRNTSYKRDGEFSFYTSRNQADFYRSGDPEGEFTRFTCKRVEESCLDMMFERFDLPGVWFRSIAAMSNPDPALYGPAIPSPDRTDTNLG